MAELPQYHKQRAIEPAPVVQGVREAYNATGESVSMMGEIGTHIAQDAANKMSALRGIEEAKNNPGKKLLPAWTESDKHFQEAFEKEAYSNSAFAATQLIQKQQLLFDQNPSTATLQLYEKNLTVGLQDIVNNAPEGIRNHVQKSLMESYNQSYFNATRTMLAKNRKDMISNTKVRIDENYKNIYNSAREGFGLDAKNKYDTLISDISSLQANGGADAEQVAAMKDTAKNMLSTGKYNGMVATAYRGGEQNAADFIRDFANNKPANRTPIEHDFIVKNMLQEYHRLQGESADSKHLALMDYENDLEANTLTPTKLADAPNVLGDKGFKQFTQKYNKAIADSRIYSEISNSVLKGENLYQYTGEQVNKAFNRTVNFAKQAYEQQGKEFGYLQRAQFAESYKDDRLRIVSETRDKILNGSAQDISEASIAIKRSDAKESAYLNNVGEEARAIADLYALYSLDKTKNPEDVAKEARLQVRKISPEDLSQRKLKLATITKKDGSESKYKLYDPVGLQEKLLDDLGLKRGIWGTQWAHTQGKAPTQLVADYKRAVAAGYNLTENMELAHNNAIRLLKRECGETKANGKKEVTMFPLEKVFPYKSITRLRNDAVVETSVKFVEQEEAFKKGQASSYYKFDKDALKGNFKEDYIYDDPIYNGKQINIIRVYRNADKLVEEKGYFEIGYDQMTGMNTAGNQFPSYPLQFAPADGSQKKDIYDPKYPATELRFTPELPSIKEAEIKKGKILRDQFASKTIGLRSSPLEGPEFDMNILSSIEKDVPATTNEETVATETTNQSFAKEAPLESKREVNASKTLNEESATTTVEEFADEKLSNKIDVLREVVTKIAKYATKDNAVKLKDYIDEHLTSTINSLVNNELINNSAEKVTQAQNAIKEAVTKIAKYADEHKGVKIKDYIDEHLTSTIYSLVDNKLISAKAGDKLITEVAHLFDDKHQDYYHEINYLHIRKLMKLNKLPDKGTPKYEETRDKLIKLIRNKDRQVEIKKLRSMTVEELLKMSDKYYEQHTA